jgi:hypothetical protein
MQETEQQALRWQPIDDLPNTPCADFGIETPVAGQLKLTVRYSWISGNADRDLLLTFPDFCGLRVHWDGDAPVVGRIENAPRCESEKFGGFIWPLLHIENPQWLRAGDFDTSNAIAEGSGQAEWQQFTVIALERSVDIIARLPVTAEWVPGREWPDLERDWGIVREKAR